MENMGAMTLVSVNFDIPNDDRTLGYENRTIVRDITLPLKCIDFGDDAPRVPPYPMMVRPIGAGEFRWVEVGPLTWIDKDRKKAVGMVLPAYIRPEVAEAALYAALEKGAKLLNQIERINHLMTLALPEINRLSGQRREEILERIRHSLEEEL